MTGSLSASIELSYIRLSKIYPGFFRSRFIGVAIVMEQKPTILAGTD